LALGGFAPSVRLPGPGGVRRPPSSIATPRSPGDTLADPRLLASDPGPGGLRFDPTDLRVPTGATVEVLFENRDEQDHTFVIDELTVLMLAGLGQTVRATVALHPGTRGTFAFYCRIPGHRASGMEGRIRVG
jgi:nitrite reductase (NO-forming)